MQILYCDLRAKWTVKGHRYFDVKWAHLLREVANVTLLCPDEEWYEDVNCNIHKETYNALEKLDKNKVLNWSIWSKWVFRHFAIKDHIEASMYIKRIIELSKNSQYDYILIGSIDLISYYFNRNKLKKISKLVFNNQSVSAFKTGILHCLFMKVKDDFIHIVMEKDGIEYMSQNYGIEKSKIHYIPHMLNPINRNLNANVDSYDIVGISNSNEDEEVLKIIEMEKKEHFFKKNGLRAIFRSKELEYDNSSLKVFKGRLGLTYDEYYTYITNSKIIVLPFSTRFGLRSSGTIMDAFSQEIPIIGNPFMTMIQYNRQIPNICKLYTTVDELKDNIIELINRKKEYKEEYEFFCKTHSNEFIINQIKETFV